LYSTWITSAPTRGAARARVHPLHWVLLAIGVVFYGLAALASLVEVPAPAT
jgi:hypothetical protein